ncbi:hypothetical protein OL233_09370 [Vagococcus sp. PNs007]|uniref:Uncharacterized protein n=1 Tax=Vagococcus proximus TaxID=2991417 RepID=A0ABT5X3C4_9ENTE|nr:hypothetical protein [Vagococcus proximus]MDF0480490.1 hypothetical protein [Vagococcus proximus]
MLFIWKNKGFLVPVAIILGYVPLIALAGFGISENYPVGSIQQRLIGMLAILTVFSPALINFLFTKYFIKNEAIKIVTDENGKEYKLNNISTFFFIKNSTWTKLLVIFPMLTLIKSFF